MLIHSLRLTVRLDGTVQRVTHVKEDSVISVCLPLAQCVLSSDPPPKKKGRSLIIMYPGSAWPPKACSNDSWVTYSITDFFFMVSSSRPIQAQFCEMEGTRNVHLWPQKPFSDLCSIALKFCWWCCQFHSIARKGVIWGGEVRVRCGCHTGLRVLKQAPSHSDCFMGTCSWLPIL